MRTVKNILQERWIVEERNVFQGDDDCRPWKMT